MILRRLDKFCNIKAVYLFIVLIIFIIWIGNQGELVWIKQVKEVEYSPPNHSLSAEDEFRLSMRERMDGVTSDFNRFKWVNNKFIEDHNSSGSKPFSFATEYEARQFIDAFSNPLKKAFPHERPKLRKYPNGMLRRHPLTLIGNYWQEINEKEIETELMRMETIQLANGDDDITQIPEIMRIIKKEDKYSIPNIVHFIWFKCRKYKIHHYMSMMSALQHHNPDLILLHTNCPPNGSLWEDFVSVADSKLKILRRSPPQKIWGKRVEKVEHQSDVARLQILLQIGGICIDDDVIVIRSLDPLRLHHQMVLGEENFDTLANSVMMANQNSWFLKRWFQEYKNFNGAKWSESSCFVPWSLWQLFPGVIHVVTEQMLRPNWEEISLIYRELFDWRDNYTIHLLARFMQELDGVDERSIMELAVLNTTYGEIARHVLWGDPNFHDLKEWILPNISSTNHTTHDVITL